VAKSRASDNAMQERVGGPTNQQTQRADTRQRTTFGNRFRFLARVLGLTGLLAIPAGWVLAADALSVPAARTGLGVGAAVSEFFQRVGALLESAYTLTTDGSGLAQIGAICLLVGVVAVGLVLLTELVGGLFLVAGRKTAVGTNMMIQIGLAVALAVIVNLISGTSYRRYDLTRDSQFTLDSGLITELKTLRANSPTTVVVLQLHKPAGVLSDKPDAYDHAAERKVVEKVKDLVGQLREFGPQFNVVTLNVEDEYYERDVRELSRKRPGLADAISNAPENSIFFYADEKVYKAPRADAERLPPTTTLPDPDDSAKSLVYQAPVTRLGFADFYRLDKTGSREATATERDGLAGVAGGLAFAPGVRGRGNLVLIPRGKQAFIRKVLALEERKPKVALAVIHPLLASQGGTVDQYTSLGLRKSLEANGFEVADVILKRWTRDLPPAADTFAEYELDRAEARYNLLNLVVANREEQIRELSELVPKTEKELAGAAAAKTTAERNQLLASATRRLQQFVRGARLRPDPEVLRKILAKLAEIVPEGLAELRRDLTEITPQLAEATAKYRELLRNERATESRRQTDVKAKLGQYVSDCDILIIPRMTIVNISREDLITSSLYNLSKEQAEVVKEFVKAGKPVLFAVGPTNVDRRGGGSDADDVEKLLPQLGIELGRQTILTDVEGQAIAERQNDVLGASVDVPPLVFDLAPTWFKLTDQSFAVLLNKELPEVVLSKLTPLKDKELQRADLESELAKLLSADEKDKFLNLILNHATRAKPTNPVNAAFLVTARSVDRKLNVKKSGYRPVYLVPGMAEKLPFAAEIASTVRESWNEERPLMDESDGPPKYDPSKPGDPKKGTRDEERRGPFPIGVAVEVKVPVDWFDSPTDPTAFGKHYAVAAALAPTDFGLYAIGMTLAGEAVKRPTVRVVALGHGGIFTGEKLDPGQEVLLLSCLNWQLKRDDRLPSDVPDEQKWRYPRADLTQREFFVWWWATFLGLPVLTIYFGLITLMIRKVR